jgi:hypothetical protein
MKTYFFRSVIEYLGVNPDPESSDQGHIQLTKVRESVIV